MAVGELDLKALAKQHRVVIVTEDLAQRALAEGYDLGDAIRTSFLMMGLNNARIALLQIDALTQKGAGNGG